MNRLSALSFLGLCALAWSAPPDLLTCERALAFGGENAPSGRCSVRVVAAPGQPPGVHTLEVRFRLDRHQKNDWIDAAYRPAPPLDLAASRTQRLWIRAEQPSDWLHIKLCDPDNPGANRAALEVALTHAGKPLPVGEWLALDLELPEEASRRDGIDSFGFYIPAANEAIPLEQDLVFHLGLFPFDLPPRPPWPPAGGSGAVRTRPVFTGLFQTNGPWILVKDENNQTGRAAKIEDGAIVFDADANGWNEYLWSDPAKLILKPLTTYRLEYDYEILRGAGGAPEACFYSLVRARGTIREDVGWARWSPPTGSRGTRILTFTTRDMPDYFLNFGIRHHGKIRISNLSVHEVLPLEGGAQ